LREMGTRKLISGLERARLLGQPLAGLSTVSGTTDRGLAPTATHGPPLRGGDMGVYHLSASVPTLGDSYSKDGKYDDTIKAYQEGLNLDPTACKRPLA
jgi:hypothetical protein